jgi:hypothetical protein
MILRAVFAIGATMASVSTLAQQEPATATLAGKPATVRFEYSRPGLPVPNFTLEVDEEGHGRYQATEVLAVSPKFAQYAGVASQQETKPVDRTLEVSRGTLETIFRTTRTLNGFNISCASKAKNIANTGDKVLTYKSADGTGRCAYNYTENKNVDLLTNIFEGIAATLDQGRKLDFDHRYDRLGLDEDMNILAKGVEEKRVLELGNIFATLSSIADDTAIMQRVRQRASSLMEQAKQTTEAAK